MRIPLRLLVVVSMVLAACPPPTPEPETLELTPTVLTLDAGETRTVTATVRTGTESAPAAGATWTSSDPAVLLVSSAGNGAATLQGLTAGTATVTAKLREATATLAVTVNAVAITLTRIELTPATPSLAKGTSLQLTATGIFSDGTNAELTGVTWTSADENILTVNAAGLVIGVTAGAAEVTAAKDGKSATLSVTVTPATLVAIDVTPALPTLAKGTTQALVATGRFTDATTQDLTQQASWSSSNPASVTVDAAGLATALDVGDSLVNATFDGVNGGTTVTVTAATLMAIDLTPASPTVPRGLTRQLNAVGRYSDGSSQGISGQVTWSSDALTIATISSSGLVTAVAIGSASISASLDGVTGSTTVTVSAAQLVSLSVTPAMPSVARGLTQPFVAMGLFSDTTTQDLTTTVTWSSTAPAVASISNAAGSEGLATGQSVGTTTIRATSGTVNAETTLTVTAATVVSLQVTPTTPSLPKGLTQQFTATAVLTDGTTADLTDTVSWTTGPVTVATISNAAGSEGLLTALTTGSCNVTATLGTQSDSTTLTVTAARLDRIDVTPAIASVAMGRTLQLTATGVYSDASTQDLTTTATWSTTPATFGSISNAAGSEGLFTATAEGEATVTVTSGTTTATRAVTVTAAVLTSLAVTPALPSVAKGRTQQFTAMGTFSDATTQNLTTQVTWTTGTPATATVSNATGSHGLASALAEGSTTVIATLGAVSGQTTLTVSPAELVSIVVSGAPATLAKGRRVSLTATGTFSDASTQDLTTQVTWTSAPTATATVSNGAGTEGEVTAVAVGTAVVTATLGGVSDDVSIAVTAAVLESLAITPADFSLAKGRTQQLSVVGTFSDATTQDLTTTVTWGSTLGAALSVSNATGSHGLASALAVGAGEVTAQSGTVTGRTNFTVTSAVLDSIAVTPAAPSIARGLTQQFTAIGTFSDATTQDLTTTANWSSGTAATATISNAPGSEGLATSASTGTTVISATSGTIVGSATLTVTAEVLVSIAVTPASPTVQVGSTQQFTATGTYSDNSTQVLTTQVTWASNTTANLTISNAAGSEGLASGIAAGTSTVSATLGTISGSTLVAVSGATLTSIAVTPADGSLAKGRTQQFTAIGTYSDASTQDLSTQVDWSTGSATVATVDNSGLVTAVAVGSTTVIATLGTVTGSTSLDITPAELVSIAVTPAASSLPKGRTAQFTATGTYSDTSTQDLTTQVIWSTGSSSIATISNVAGVQGLATAVDVGSTTVEATLGFVTGSTAFDVIAAELVSIAVTGAPATLAMGLTAQLTATGTYSDASTQDLTTQVTWLATPGTTATISNTAGTQGRLTAVAIGTASLTATLGSVTGAASTDVTAAELVSIAVTPADPTVIVGATLQLTATGTYTDSTTQNLTATATWTSLAQAVATVSSSGLVTGVAAGSAQIDAVVGAITGSTSVTVPVQPAVSATTPASAATGVFALTSISVTFTMAMTPATLTTQATGGPCTGSVQVSLNDFASCLGLAAPALSGGNTIATTKPAPALAFGTAYKVRVTTSAASSVGGPLASEFTLAAPFTTGVDSPIPTGLVISQVYGGGGNTGAPYQNDFIELHNPSTAAINLNGMAVQYASASGSTWQITVLPNVDVPAGGYFLVQEAAGAGSAAALPTPDATGTISMSATSGKVALTSTTTALTGTCPAGGAVLDLVGFGGANCSEGAVTPALSATTAALRRKAGCVDDNNNSLDFTVGAPTPRNSTSASNPLCTLAVNETGSADELDFCNLQHPPSTTTSTGMLTEEIYGRVFHDGVTQGAGGNPLVRAEFGYGPVNANPQNQPGWVWFPGTFNVQLGNDDEYKFAFTAPAEGQYAYTSRFSLDGLNWTYCDLSGAGANAGLTFEPSWLGSLTVTP